MAKKKGKLIEFFIKIFGDSFDRLLNEGGEGVEKLLDEGLIDEPELTQELVPILYKYWRKLVEKFVGKTKTKIDDKVVAEVREAIERFAAKNNIELPAIIDTPPVS